MVYSLSCPTQSQPILCLVQHSTNLFFVLSNTIPTFCLFSPTKLNLFFFLFYTVPVYFCPVQHSTKLFFVTSNRLQTYCLSCPTQYLPFVCFVQQSTNLLVVLYHPSICPVQHSTNLLYVLSNTVLFCLQNWMLRIWWFLNFDPSFDLNIELKENCTKPVLAQATGIFPSIKKF